MEELPSERCCWLTAGALFGSSRALFVLIALSKVCLLPFLAVELIYYWHLWDVPRPRAGRPTATVAGDGPGCRGGLMGSIGLLGAPELQRALAAPLVLRQRACVARAGR